MPKVSQSDWAEIFRLYHEERLSQPQIACLYGVSHQTYLRLR